MSVPRYAAKELQTLLSFARETLRAAGAPAVDYFRRQPTVTNKDSGTGYDPVTVADRAVERLVRERIRAAFPDDAIIGEEDGADGSDGARCWTIDPIDGTRAYVSGFVQWGLLLALSVDGRPLLGVVHQPYIDETWSGSALGAAFERGGRARESIAVRACPDLASAVLATTDPFLFLEPEAQPFHALRRSVRLTRYGGDCYAYCLLAMGQLDLVVESGLAPWDVRALIPIIKAAGGQISDWRGGDCFDGGQVLASGDARVHALALQQLACAAE